MSRAGDIPAAARAGAAAPVEADTQIRGSVLLLAGRGISLVINLLIQVAIVRYLSKHDYGAFAYAFSLVEAASMAAALGMDKTLARFGAIYHERGDLPRLCGALLLTGAVTLGLGAGLAAALCAGPALVGGTLAADRLTVAALGALAFLVPANAFGSAVLSVLTIFGGARSVLLRKHLLGPGARLAAVLGVMALGGGVREIALALLAAGLCGAAADALLVVRLLRRCRLWDDMVRRRPVIPAREIFGHSLPLLSTDVVSLARGALVVLLLGVLQGETAAASFRAVLPVVRLNDLVILNFALMFTPLASRTLARNNLRSLGEMYWRNTLWTMVLSFPVFAACVALARPLVVLMFGREYADSAVLLVVLSVGYYVQASFGFSSRVLKILGLVRPVVLIDLAATAVILAACAALTPPFGAVGAAAAVSGGIVLHTLLRQAALIALTDLGTLPLRSALPYFVAAACGLALVLAQALFAPGIAAGAALAAGMTCVVVFASRRRLQVDAVFPEVRAVPWLHRWLTASES